MKAQSPPFKKRADALANYAFDSGALYEWQPEVLKDLLSLVPAANVPTFHVQGCFDGAFRKGCNRSAIGGCLELVTELPGKGQALLLLARDISCQDSYEAEAFAAEALT